MSTRKTILVTGCSSGIGLYTAQTLHQLGWLVFAGVRNPADQSHLQRLGLNSVLLDLQDSLSIKTAVESILLQTGQQLDALCNNAGFGQPGAIEDLSREALRLQFETNVFGLQELTNLIIPIMRRQGYGRIINISSVLGFVTMGYRGAYCASKYALESLTDALRLELYNSGIYISLIEPGPIKSAFRDKAQLAYKQHIAMEKSVHFINYTAFLQNREKLNTTSAFVWKPEAVFKKIMHALQSPRPKIRYYVTQ